MLPLLLEPAAVLPAGAEALPFEMELLSGLLSAGEEITEGAEAPPPFPIEMGDFPRAPAGKVKETRELEQRAPCRRPEANPEEFAWAAAPAPLPFPVSELPSESPSASGAAPKFPPVTTGGSESISMVADSQVAFRLVIRPSENEAPEQTGGQTPPETPPEAERTLSRPPAKVARTERPVQPESFAALASGPDEAAGSEIGVTRAETCDRRPIRRVPHSEVLQRQEQPQRESGEEKGRGSEPPRPRPAVIREISVDKERPAAQQAPHVWRPPAAVRGAEKETPAGGEPAAPPPEPTPVGPREPMPPVIRDGAPVSGPVRGEPQIGEVRRVAEVRLPNSEPRPPAAPARQVSMRLEAADQRPVEVSLMDRAGRVEVAVRAADEHVRRVLRADLGELVRRLEGRGFEVRGWEPAAVAAAEGDFEAAAARENTPESRRQPDEFGEPDRRRQRHDAHAAWLELIEGERKKGGSRP
jgi:hypothetical protein